jgi:hypothetical protein
MAIESFGRKRFDHGIEALSSQTCVNLLKKGNIKHKQVVKSNRELTS